MDEATLEKLDALAHGRERMRSPLIREAVQRFVSVEGTRRTEEADAAMYRKHAKLVGRQAAALVAEQADLP